MKWFVMSRGFSGGGYHPMGKCPFEPIEAKNRVEAIIAFYGEEYRKGIEYDMKDRHKDGTPEKPFSDPGISDICAVPANTRIDYMYRDGHNYKQSHEVILAGVMSWDQIKEKFEDDNHFIASQVGLEDIQTLWEEKGFTFPNEADHVWCELNEEDIDYTFLPPTIELTADELVSNFENVEWDVAKAMESLGL